MRLVIKHHLSFVDFCRLVGAEPYIAANITTTTPLDIRDWVDYYDTPNIIALFEDHFRKPKTWEEGELLSPTEIMARLKQDVSNRSNATLLGTYLKRNGFQRGERAERRCYRIIAK